MIIKEVEVEFGEVLKSMPVPSPHERVGVELQFAARSLKRVFNKLVLLEKKARSSRGWLERASMPFARS